MTSELITTIVNQALIEDATHNDVTSLSLVPDDHQSIADILIKHAPVTVCGIDVMIKVFKAIDPNVSIQTYSMDGEEFTQTNQKVISVSGSTRSLLSAERTALNFLALGTAIATQTQRYTKAIAGTKASIFDTRKTLPGLRAFQKYAITCGGGKNHRFNLSDMILIKDNHRHLFNDFDIDRAIKAARKSYPHIPIEIEIESLTDFQKALLAQPDFILLDNMTPNDVRQAVQWRDTSVQAKHILLEASGGINIDTVRAMADTGVERISVGSLTYSIEPIDVSMELRR